jgi:superfamily II DNA or RNA helicase
VSSDLGGIDGKSVPTIYDNQSPGHVLAEALKSDLAEATGIDICVGYLNLRGWRQLVDEIDALPRDGEQPVARVLVGMAFNPGETLRRNLRVRSAQENWRGVTNEEIPALKSAAVADLRDQLATGLPSNPDELVLRRLADQVRSGRVLVKFFACGPLHAKLYLVHLAATAAPRKAYVGSSNLTLAGLVHQGELNVDVLDKDATEKLHSWFGEQWNRECAVPIDLELIDVIDESWASEYQPEPYLLHLKLAYELARDAREGFRDYDIPDLLQGVLLQHQADAVRVASKIIERRGGVMIGDVVGLGKTLVAVACARLLQELQGFQTLVVCPKNLVPMWEEHFHKYRLLGRVVPLSMAHKDLLEMPRHRLLIVDESHNIRNEETRGWEALRRYVDVNEPQVMLLTATPFNKDYGDVAGQLRLFLDPDADLGIRPEVAIDQVGEVEIARKSGGKLTTLRAFEQSAFPEDWQRLMSLFLVRRTRRFIEERYGELDDTGRVMLRFADGTPFYFPARVPRPLEYDGGRNDPSERLASVETVDRLSTLRLPRCRLADYLLDEDLAQNETDLEAIEKMKRARGNLHGFVRTSLLKRLASSGPAFLLSIERHILRNWVAVYALENGFPYPLGAVESARWDFGADSDGEHLPGFEVALAAAADRTNEEWLDFASARYEKLRSSRPAGIEWISSRLFASDLIEDLVADADVLQELLHEFGHWNPLVDSKISALVRLVNEEHRGEKVIVFSEYADTARYVAGELSAALARFESRAVVECVTGATDDPTRLARRFSPVSNTDLGGLPDSHEEIDVLIATDVLSEGQNLQDAAIVVNYDLPWTIIPIIQRAGRVDRVGQRSSEVVVYSMLPQDGVEQVILLRKRIAERLRENAAAFESDERFFDTPDEAIATIRGLFDGTADLQDLESPNLVDWASLAMSIWDTASEDDRARASALPDVVYSTKIGTAPEKPGVLVYARTALGIDSLAWAGADESVSLVDPFQALEISRAEPAEPARERFHRHFDLLKLAVEGPLLESVRSTKITAYSGVQRRLYEAIRGHLELIKGQFGDTPEARQLMDSVYSRPIRESAKNRITKALQERSREEVVDLAQAMLLSGDLLVDPLEYAEDELRIVCSVGVRLK